MRGNLTFSLLLACALAVVQLGCSSLEGDKPVPLYPRITGDEFVPAPTAISDRGAQEHGKVWPMSIDSAYMGYGGDNRNSGGGLVTGFEQRRIVGHSEYLSSNSPASPPVASLV